MDTLPRGSLASDEIESFPVHFEGEEREYFRLWAGNAALIALTLGLYTPMAKRRRLRYFLGLTEVAGNPLEFTAPWLGLFKGFLVVAGLYLAYAIASESGQHGVVNRFLVAAGLLTPWVWGSARRFRLAHTQWRGVRLRFTATWPEIYIAQWPLVPLAVLLVSAPALLRALAEAATPWHTTLLGLALAADFALVLACMARLDCNCVRLVTLRTQVGHLPCRWRSAGPRQGDFLRTWFLAAGLGLAVQLATIVLVFAGTGLLGLLITGDSNLELLAGVAVTASLPMAWASWSAAAGLRQARIFRQVWDRVAVGDAVRLRCDLDTGAYTRLCLCNAMLCALTLGLWWPWAVVRQYRMRVESITVHVKGWLEDIATDLAHPPQALGDAVADLMGLELVN